MNNDTVEHKDMSLPRPAATEEAAAPMPVQQPVMQDEAVAQSTYPHMAGSSTAEDADDIEKAWIDRVEQLMGTYLDDPRALSEHFAALRSEYIMQRYGKSVKKAEK